MNEIPKILLTFNGAQDPFSKSGTEGPILSLLQEKEFQKIIIFHTPSVVSEAHKTAGLIHDRRPRAEVVTCELAVADPTSYETILKELRIHFSRLCQREEPAEYFISVSSGTPQMHACWMMLAASGEIPANVFHVRERRFIQPGQPLITEINPRIRDDFPVIRQRITMEELPEIPGDQIEKAVQEVGIIGEHPKLKQALEIAAKAAQTDVPILIYGETGTGKELFAKFIHFFSKRCGKPMISHNCSTFTDTLSESELFGHKKGAFTGAVSDKKGLFDSADGSTLFMDEIGDIPLSIQPKILRAVEYHEIKPIGGQKPHQVDVRLISATNRDLKKAMQDGLFRKDLYNRISVISIELPSLNDRRTDIPLLARYFLDRVNLKIGKTKRLSDSALAALQRFNWKETNIRGLQNTIERTGILSSKEIIGKDDLRFDDLTDASEFFKIPEPYDGFDLHAYLGDIRKRLILRAMELSGGNKSGAGRLLGVTSPAIDKMLKKYQTS